MKSEILGNLIGMTKEEVENDIDKGMWDILIELNKKNYKTIFCCEGHLHEDNRHGIDYWNGYIAFAETYNFLSYPIKFHKISHGRRYFYWDGNGEESRQEFLTNLLRKLEISSLEIPC